MNFFWCQDIFFMNFDFKNGGKMNLSITTKNHGTDPKIELLTKSISKPFGRATTMPQAWELTQRLEWLKKSIF